MMVTRQLREVWQFSSTSTIFTKQEYYDLPRRSHGIVDIMKEMLGNILNYSREGNNKGKEGREGEEKGGRKRGHEDTFINMGIMSMTEFPNDCLKKHSDRWEVIKWTCPLPHPPVHRSLQKTSVLGMSGV